MAGSVAASCGLLSRMSSHKTSVAEMEPCRDQAVAGLLPPSRSVTSGRSCDFTAAIAVDKLVKRYKTATAVDGISFALTPGTVTGLLGGNGAGKTTTIAMIMGLVSPTSGTRHACWAREMPTQRYRVLHRMNFESPYVDMPMRLTVRQNLKVFGMLYGVADAARPHRQPRRRSRPHRVSRPARPASCRPGRRPASRWPRR